MALVLLLGPSSPNFCDAGGASNHMDLSLCFWDWYMTQVEQLENFVFSDFGAGMDTWVNNLPEFFLESVMGVRGQNLNS